MTAKTHPGSRRIKKNKEAGSRLELAEKLVLELRTIGVFYLASNP